jgi:hypothetical protein
MRIQRECARVQDSALCAHGECGRVQSTSALLGPLLRTSCTLRVRRSFWRMLSHGPRVHRSHSQSIVLSVVSSTSGSTQGHRSMTPEEPKEHSSYVVHKCSLHFALTGAFALLQNSPRAERKFSCTLQHESRGTPRRPRIEQSCCGCGSARWAVLGKLPSSHLTMSDFHSETIEYIYSLRWLFQGQTDLQGV